MRAGHVLHELAETKKITLALPVLFVDGARRGLMVDLDLIHVAVLVRLGEADQAVMIAVDDLPIEVSARQLPFQPLKRFT